MSLASDISTRLERDRAFVYLIRMKYKQVICEWLCLRPPSYPDPYDDTINSQRSLGLHVFSVEGLIGSFLCLFPPVTCTLTTNASTTSPTTQPISVHQTDVMKTSSATQQVITSGKENQRDVYVWSSVGLLWPTKASLFCFWK